MLFSPFGTQCNVLLYVIINSTALNTTHFLCHSSVSLVSRHNLAGPSAIRSSRLQPGCQPGLGFSSESLTGEGSFPWLTGMLAAFSSW